MLKMIDFMEKRGRKKNKNVVIVERVLTLMIGDNTITFYILISTAFEKIIINKFKMLSIEKKRITKIEFQDLWYTTTIKMRKNQIKNVCPLWMGSKKVRKRENFRNLCCFLFVQLYIPVCTRALLIDLLVKRNKILFIESTCIGICCVCWKFIQFHWHISHIVCWRYVLCSVRPIRQHISNATTITFLLRIMRSTCVNQLFHWKIYYVFQVHTTT